MYVCNTISSSIITTRYTNTITYWGQQTSLQKVLVTVYYNMNRIVTNLFTKTYGYLIRCGTKSISNLVNNVSRSCSTSIQIFPVGLIKVPNPTEDISTTSTFAQFLAAFCMLSVHLVGSIISFFSVTESPKIVFKIWSFKQPVGLVGFWQALVVDVWRNPTLLCESTRIEIYTKTYTY